MSADLAHMTLTATKLAAESQRYSDAFITVCAVEIVAAAGREAELLTQCAAANPAHTTDTAR